MQGAESLRNILVIDDDLVFLELIQHILEEYISGDIHTFSSSIEAMDYISNHSEMSLIICDWHMPKADGLDVLAALRKKDQRVPFLMLTSNPTKELVMAAKKGGANGFIAKPFKDHELLGKIETLLH